MANLKEIRSRISSVKNTQQITKAMKMVSAAKLRRAQDNIQNLRPYAHGLLEVISDVALTHRVSHPLLSLTNQEPQKILLVVVTSDRGLCGPFNSNVIKFTEQYYTEKSSQVENIDLFIIGKKAVEILSKRTKEPIESMTNMAKDISYSVAAEISEKLMTAFSKGHYDEIQFVYNEFKSAISQERVAETFLPVDLSKGQLTGEGSQFSEDLIFEPEPEVILDELLEKHFAVQVYRCLSESIAAEHAARMTSMDNATNNAKDMINDLTLTYNKLRQASITTELIEITSGAEALNG